MEQFDDIFRKKLEQYDSGTPDHLWEKIAEKSKSATPPTTVIPVPWIITAVAVVALAGMVFYFQAGNKGKVTGSQKTEIPAKDNAAAGSIMPEKDGLAETDIASSENPTQNIESQNIANNKIAAGNGLSEVKDVKKQESIGSPGDQFNDKARILRENRKWYDQVLSETNRFLQSTNAPKEPVIAAPIVPAIPKAEVSSPPVVTVPEKKQGFTTLPYTYRLVDLPVWDKPAPAMKECYTFKGNCEKIYLEPYISADYVQSDITVATNEYEEYLNARRSTETPVLAYGAGIRMSLLSCRGFAIRSGLGYSQATDRFDYSNANATQSNVISVLIDTLFPTSGDTILVFDTLSVVQHGTHLQKTFNHYRSIDIPLIMGYELETYKWIFSFNGGVLFNIVSWQKGDFLDPELQPVTFTSSEEGHYKAFKTNTGVSLTANLGFYYKLANYSQILFEPFVRYPLKPVTIDGYPLTQRQITGGVRVGIRMPIGR